MGDVGLGSRLVRGVVEITAAGPATIEEFCDRLYALFAEQANSCCLLLGVDGGVGMQVIYAKNTCGFEVDSARCAQIMQGATSSGTVMSDSIGTSILTALPLCAEEHAFGALAVLTPQMSFSAGDLYDLQTAAVACASFIWATRSSPVVSRFEHLAMTDALTALPNRRAFDERLRVAWSRALRGDYPLATVIVDVDFFGAYNKLYGHPAGDECLQRVASALAGTITRDDDMVARYGGEEFMAVLPVTDLAGAIIVAERMRAAVESLRIEHGGTRLGVLTISVGVASAQPTRDLTPAALVREADAWLLRAKTSGRNRVAGLDYTSQAPINERRYDARHNLPHQIAEFIGRESELAEVDELLARSRLLTVVGAGGVGKSRLVCELAQRCSNRYADGVCYVDLGTVQRGQLVVPAIANALGLQVQGQTALDAIVDRLGRVERLIVLDNCEQVIESAAEAIQTILQQTERITVLATSRETLELSGEVRYRLYPLSHPDARALFTERLSAANGARALEAPDENILESICERLDRLPLAIELIAPRAAEIGVVETLTVLEDASFVLSASARGSSPRQQTISNLLGWSYQLLDATERALFRRLAVFAGTWDEAAAAHICVDTTESVGHIALALDELVRKSLAVRDAADGRFHMLGLTNSFALHCLREADEEHQFRRRHLHYYLSLSRSVGGWLRDGAFERSASAVNADAANIVAALQFALGEAADVEAGAEIVANIAPVWDTSGRWDLARFWLDVALSYRESLSDPIVADLLAGSAMLAYTVSDHNRCVQFGREAIVYYRHWNDRRMISLCLSIVASGLLYDAQYEEAENLNTESLDIAEAIGDERLIARQLVNLGNIALEWRKDFKTSARLYGAATRILRRIESGVTLPIALLNYANAYYYLQQYTRAIDLLDEAIGIFARMGHKALGIALTSRSRNQLELGNLDAARADLARAVGVYSTFASPRWSAFCLEQSAALAERTGDHARAARLFGFLRRYREETGIKMPPPVVPEMQIVESSVRAALTEDDFEKYLRDGADWSYEKAFAAAVA